MNRNVFSWAMIAFATVGLFVSAYLTYLSSMPPTSCPLGSFSVFSCNEVIYSAYSKFYGISVALLGLGWFIIAFGLILLTKRDWHFIRAVMAWSLLGTVAVVAFIYTELFLIGSVCPLCTIAHVMGIAILVLSALGVRDRTATADS